MAESAPSPAEESSEAGYSSTDLKHLSDREHVRERFGMYIGDNTSRGLHHLVYEVVDNSIDECMAEYAHRVSVIVNVGPSGVFIAIIFSETLLTVMAVWFFRKDSWLKQQI